MEASAITARLETCYTAVVHDIMRKMGLRDFVLPSNLRPILPDQILAGPIFTILGKVDPTADPHETLLAWTGLLSACPEGHVWVNKTQDNEVAHMGELSAETLRDKGVRGAVVDGMARDISFLKKLKFQTFCSGFTPRDIVGWWLPAATQIPIRIGMVDIKPGDYILGDIDGLIRIPQEHIEDIVTQAEHDIGTESAIRKAIQQGIDPQEAYLKYGKF